MCAVSAPCNVAPVPLVVRTTAELKTVRAQLATSYDQTGAFDQHPLVECLTPGETPPACAAGTASTNVPTNLTEDVATTAKPHAPAAGQVAVVMTMGALHEGHLELVRHAAACAEHVIVTIFVNPLQFGVGEDFDAYPRTVAQDVAKLTGLGVSMVFAPEQDVIYPWGDPQVRVTAGPVGDLFEGATRPGHFDGVLTVVAKLLHLTTPDVAVFGAKDAQQVALIQAMVRDLDFPVELVTVPTVREPDGLAMSSRNRYLDATQRQQARALSAALAQAERVAAAGGTVGQAQAAGQDVLAAAQGVRPDYCEVVMPQTFAPAAQDALAAGNRAIVAAWVGSTRLIDNAVLGSCGSEGAPDGLGRLTSPQTLRRKPC